MRLIIIFYKLNNLLKSREGTDVCFAHCHTIYSSDLLLSQ